MTLATDYQVLGDANSLLQVGGVLKFPFHLPDSAALDQAAVLFFRVLIKDVEEYHFEMKLNDASVFTWVAVGNLPADGGSFHEVIGAGALKHGANVLKIFGSGLLFDQGTFADLLLMFKRKI
jgi:hypothetical protein